MNLVIDASVTVAWYFDDETTPVTEAVLDRVSETGAIVPTLWRLEVANAFQSAIRRKRITTRRRLVMSQFEFSAQGLSPCHGGWAYGQTVVDGRSCGNGGRGCAETGEAWAV